MNASAAAEASATSLCASPSAALVDPPARATYEMRPLSREEAQAFLASLAATEDEPADRFETLYTLALHTGARQGELLGLRWSDVDDGSLTIRHTLRQGTQELGAPKTNASRRTMALGPTAQAALRKHRAVQAEQRLKAGTKWQDLDFVFTTRYGTPLDGVNVTRAFQRSLKAADLPALRFHDLRHSYATLALEAGVDLAVVSKSLGHSNVSTTADIYLHWTKHSAEQTSSVMESEGVPSSTMRRQLVRTRTACSCPCSSSRARVFVR